MDIIDRVVSGVGALTLTGSTTTLTTTDGTLTDGMYRVLVLGDDGDVGSDNTITISPNDQDKLYLVYNNLTANRSAIFSQGSGDNATVENGETAWIYADGAGSGAAVRVATSSTKLLDQDGDTGIRVEEGGDDDDTIRFDVAGAEDFTITANTFTAQTGSTIAAQALTATTIGSSAGITITGTTPTLTIGDTDAEDAKIVFDGNAQDFHIGLDDTADDLVIGLGSALGTTTHMAFTEDGEITKPLQPAFQVIPASTQTNINVNAYTGIAFGTERFDVGANFASDTFTAPVTGKYWLGVDLYLGNIDSDANYYNLLLETSNKQYGITWSVLALDQDANYWQMALSTFCDMDASDTAYIRMYQSGGTSQTDINTDNSHFAGYLAC
jgi:hypothetical protein